jgi:hypothetical protein
MVVDTPPVRMEGESQRARAAALPLKDRVAALLLKDRTGTELLKGRTAAKQ